MSADAEQMTVVVTKHDTLIPGLGETRENYRAVVEGFDVAARGSTPVRAIENTMASIRKTEHEALPESIDSTGGDL